MDVKEILKNYLSSDGKLKTYPSRKLKTAVLFFLAGKFEYNRIYTEKEVNSVIEEACYFNDIPLLRRELYNYRFLDRKIDGSCYWKEEIQPKPDALGVIP